ncbi:MAG: hypothetical protein AMXMBFR75_33070 [Candidatus Hinthialibacteria bacterium]
MDKLGMPQFETGPIVFQKAYDLTLWYADHTTRFPKGYRFTLADRIQEVLFSLLGVLQNAAFGKDRKQSLRAAQDCIDQLRLWNRLAKDLKCLNQRQYSFASKQIEEIGKQIGGWNRSLNGITHQRDRDVPATA